MKKMLLYILTTLMICSCSNNSQIIDKENNTVFFDGVSCTDKGQLINHLKESGFRQVKTEQLNIDGNSSTITVFEKDQIMDSET